MPFRCDNTILQRLKTSTAIALASAFIAPVAQALPTGGNVAAGQAAITSSGTNLTVTQSSSRAVLDWNSFDIGQGEGVNFIQPSSISIALNRIHSGNPTDIEGSLTANGQVWLINPNGVFFGKNAQVNVAGLVATSSDIDNAAFMNGNFNFTHPGQPNSAIVNEGTITVADAGLVALVAPGVVNAGVITAKLGKVQMESGDTFAIDPYGDGLYSLAVSDQVTQQLVGNSGLISANGGSVKLTAAAGSQIVNSLINNTGIIEAESIGTENGEIVLYAAGSNAVANNVSANKGQAAGSSTVVNSGVLDASGYGAGQTGGSISVLADNVGILSGSIIDASGDAGGGTIKIGGEFHGAGTTPTALNTYVDPNAYILANAATSGNGGNVAVWSDGNTWFYGNIIAEGGASSGNGGFVETSGHGYLDAEGYVDLTAPNGNKGTYLLDPTNIEIFGNVRPAFDATDGSINLASALQLWLDASNATSVQLTYNDLSTTATGTIGTNTISVGSNTGLVVGERIQIGGVSD